MSRKNADPLVGLPSLTQKSYSAAENKGVDMKSLRFRKRSDHFSMYVRGFCLDEVAHVEQASLNGQIPQEWATLGGWPGAKGPPPDDFWRTLVADRGRDGRNPPVYYSRACRESFSYGGLAGGAIDTMRIINFGRNSILAQFCRRVQAVVWNRSMFRTDDDRLGLASKDIKQGDKICILYGCSVPIILRRSEKKSPAVFDQELDLEIEFIVNKIKSDFKRYITRKRQNKIHRHKDMVEICRQWKKDTGWPRDYVI